MFGLPDVKNYVVIKTPRELRAAKNITISRYIICEDGNVIFIWERSNGQWNKRKYVLFDEDRDRDFDTSGFTAYKQFYAYCGREEVERMKKILSPIPIWESQEQMHYANIDFVGEKIYQPIYEFDANSAFTYGTLQLPSGFDKLKEYMLYLYDKKSNAETKLQRSKYKNLQNYLIGYFARIKQLIRVRSDIILKSNLNIKTRMGEIVDAGGKVYLSNTDSIVTDSIGADIMQRHIGVGVGQFKLSSQTDRLFYQSSNSYQLGDKVVWSGVKYFAQKNTDFFQDKVAQQQGTLVDSFDYCISENKEYRLCRVREGEIKVTVTNTIGELLETKRYRIKE